MSIDFALQLFIYILLVVFIVLFTIVACKWQDEVHRRIAIEQDQDVLLEEYILKCDELNKTEELIITLNSIINELRNKLPDDLDGIAEGIISKF